MRIRLSRSLVINTLCCANGIMLAVFAATVRAHWGELVGLYEEIAKCVEVLRLLS
jgi:hypothetical protein